MNIGAHVRGGGKLVPSLELGVDMGATSIQIFTQSPRMWKPSQYAPEVLAAYRDAAALNPVITDTFCHATYLINLATADLELYEKSVACLTHNLSVARGIASSGLVLHVGSHHGAGFDDVVRQIADAFERALAEADPAPDGAADCPILIENAAGADGPIGRTFEEIHLLIDACNSDDRLGMCIDTQHLWASGFDYASEAGTERLILEIETTVGMDRLRCFHLNDSKIELGGNRDRHANIGEGTIGTRGLAAIIGHPRFRDVPMILEVPGSGDGPRAEDVTVAKEVMRAGIALYDGSDLWVEILPAIAPTAAPSAAPVRKAAKKTASTTTKAAKKAAPAAKKAPKKTASTTKKGAGVKKSAKKISKKAAKKAAAKSLKAATRSAKSLKKGTKKGAAVKKSAKKISKKVAKKAAVKSLKKATSKPTERAARKSAKKLATKADKSSKTTAKKTLKKSTSRAKGSAKKLAKKATKNRSTKKSAKK
ncbi:MAG: deoxyribonuclease IV [Acidimicrobiales bacterium]